MDKIRVYRCHWTKDGKIQKTALTVTKKQYEFLDKKPVSKEFSNQWFENYPYKWYEFNYLRSFITKSIDYIKRRYANKSGIKRFSSDLFLFVLSSIIATAILKFVLKWI